MGEVAAVREVPLEWFDALLSVLRLCDLLPTTSALLSYQCAARKEVYVGFICGPTTTSLPCGFGGGHICTIFVFVGGASRMLSDLRRSLSV